jgi:hypothetical protein
MKLWPGQSNPSGETGGEDFERAAARVSAELPADPGPGAAAGGEEEGESLEIRPEWAVFVARTPFEIGAKFYHPAFALSDEQAYALGPKFLPLMQKVADEWIPRWLGSVGNRNPELFDACAAFAVTAFVQWQHVEKIRQLEAAERAEAAAAARKPESGVLVMPPDTAPAPVKVGNRDEEGRLVI